MNTKELMKNSDNSAIDNSQNSLEEKMFQAYGLLIGGLELSKILGFNTNAAFRKALSNDVIGVPVFQIDNRKGKFALTQDVAKWLFEQKTKNTVNRGN